MISSSNDALCQWQYGMLLSLDHHDCLARCLSFSPFAFPDITTLCIVRVRWHRYLVSLHVGCVASTLKSILVWLITFFSHSPISDRIFGWLGFVSVPLTSRGRDNSIHDQPVHAALQVVSDCWLQNATYTTQMIRTVGRVLLRNPASWAGQRSVMRCVNTAAITRSYSMLSSSFKSFPLLPTVHHGHACQPSCVPPVLLLSLIPLLASFFDAFTTTVSQYMNASRTWCLPSIHAPTAVSRSYGGSSGSTDPIERAERIGLKYIGAINNR